MIESQVDEVRAATGQEIGTAAADAGYAFAKVYGGLERRGIDPLIPAKREPAKSRVPLRRFRYDAKHDIMKCPRGKVLRPGKPRKHGRFFHAKAKDCARCPLKSDCLSKQSRCRTVIIGDDYPALLRGRRQTLRRSEEDRQLYRRHFWRSEGFHGETKTQHGLRRAVRRGLGNMKIQSCPTAAAINLKRLAAAFDARFPASGKIRMREMLVSAVLARWAGRIRLTLPGGPPTGRAASASPEIVEGRVIQRPRMNTATQQEIIGLDVSRDWLDLHCLSDSRQLRLPSTDAGHAELEAVAGDREALVCLEYERKFMNPILLLIISMLWPLRSGAS